VERHILGLEREGADVPGALVPELYRLFLQDGNAAPLKGVFYHNKMDILSLAALRSHLGTLIRGGEGTEGERVAAGDLWFRRGRPDRAREIWSLACASGNCTPALERLAELARRRRDWKEAAELWERALPLTKRPVEVFVELAKIYEHRTKETERALKMTDRALEALMERRAFMGSSWRRTRQELLHRKNRLERKMARTDKISP
jgi:tetratricopeptide (TPR) repeat protein